MKKLKDNHITASLAKAQIKSQPIEVFIENRSPEGKYVDVFRSMNPSPEPGIKLSANVRIPADDSPDIELTWEDVMKMLFTKPLHIGLTRLDYSVPLSLATKKIEKSYLVTFDANGCAVVVPFYIFLDPYMERSDAFSWDDEYLLDACTFIRIWAPAESRIRLSLFRKADAHLARAILDESFVRQYEAPALLKKQDEEMKENISIKKPVTIWATNEGEQGEWVDFFRADTRLPQIRMEVGHLDMKIDEEQKVAIGYDEFLRVFHHERHVVSLTRLHYQSDSIVKELPEGKDRLELVTWETYGRFVFLPMPFDWEKIESQHQKSIVEFSQEYHLDASSFLRCWVPAKSMVQLVIFDNIA